MSREIVARRQAEAAPVAQPTGDVVPREVPAYPMQYQGIRQPMSPAAQAYLAQRMQRHAMAGEQGSNPFLALGYGNVAGQPGIALANPDQLALSPAQEQPSKKRKHLAIGAGIAALALVVTGGYVEKDKIFHTEDPAATAAAAIEAAGNTPPSYTASVIPGCMDVATISFDGNGIINIPVPLFTKSKTPAPVKDALTQTTAYASVKGNVAICDPSPTAKNKKPLAHMEKGMYVVDRSVLSTVFEIADKDGFSCANTMKGHEKDPDCYRPYLDNVSVSKKHVSQAELDAKYGFDAAGQKLITDIKNPKSATYATYKKLVTAQYQLQGLESLKAGDANVTFQKTIDAALEQYLLSKIPDKEQRHQVAGRFNFEGSYIMPDKDFVAKAKTALASKLASVVFAPDVIVKAIVPTEEGVK